MKQIVVISGKGGTGKTIITACMAALAENKVMVDCDVDAADLHLLLHPEVKERYEFKGLPKAEIDQEKCTRCGECEKVCRYGAIMNGEGKSAEIIINSIACEGCKICMYTCSADAISMLDNVAGEWYVSDTKYGQMVHAKLGIAEANSGKLVSVVQQKAMRIAEENNFKYVIIDGPPGIGCPVIASLSGVDLAVVVTEPTLSGIQDMERVINVARYFEVSTACVINKYDINLVNTKNIIDWCRTNNISFLGKIPFDQSVADSIVKGIPLVEYTKNSITRVITEIWEKLS